MSGEIQRPSDKLLQQAGIVLEEVEINDCSILDSAIKIPFGEIASFGMLIDFILKNSRSANMVAEGIYKVVLPQGAKALKTLKNGKIVGAFAKMNNGGSKLAELIPVDGIKMAASENPELLAVAVVLFEINRKLDSIQQTHQEMFEYLRQKDEAKRRGNLEILVDILENYHFNIDNDTYKINKHILVQDIRKDAEQDILFFKEQIVSIFEDKELIDLNAGTEKRALKILSLLKDYQIAVYLFSFSSFLEALLLENYNKEYLNAVAKKIDDRSIEYRKLYTTAYNQLERQGRGTLEQQLLGIFSGAGSYLGKAIKKTPVGDTTPIDEALIGMSKNLDRIKKSQIHVLMENMPSAKAVDVKPFVEGIVNINKLFNKKAEILTDGEAIYLLPQGKMLNV